MCDTTSTSLYNHTPPRKQHPDRNSRPHRLPSSAKLARPIYQKNSAVAPTMFPPLLPVLFALLHLAIALPTTTGSKDTHRLQKRLETGPIVALSICIPGAALVLGLGIGILWLYPKQLRKLRAQNPGREVGFADLMNGRVSTQAPPVYKEHEGSEHELDTHSAPGQAQAGPPPDARHAALAV